MKFIQCGAILSCDKSFFGVDFQIVEIKDQVFHVQQTYNGEVVQYNREDLMSSFTYQYRLNYNLYQMRWFYVNN